MLALLNAFLLLSLSTREGNARTARRTAQQELVTLFASDGMTLDPALIPEETPISAYALARDEALEQKAASFLLGDEPARTEQGGGLSAYRSAAGTAVFRDTGSFDVVLTRPHADAASLCADFCRKFSYSDPEWTLDGNGSGTASAHRVWEGAPVFNGTVTFTVERGTVTVVSGTLVPGNGMAAESEQEPLSAFAALTAFQQMRHASSSVVSTITEIRLCYELQSTAASPILLVPAWQIVTDTASFYVNCISGAVRRA